MKGILGLIIAAVLLLATVKVRNELKMTEAYDRQAVALERIANFAEIYHYAEHPSIVYEGHIDTRGGQWSSY